MVGCWDFVLYFHQVYISVPLSDFNALNISYFNIRFSVKHFAIDLAPFVVIGAAIAYEDCLLYFGIREQKQILIIENRFIVFQNMTVKIYTLLHEFEPIVEALLSLWLIEFFERLTNFVGSNANKFFWQSNVHTIMNVCWFH